MFVEPKPLPEGSMISGFTPDASSNWLAAYAGPCNAPDCGQPHTRLFMVPIIGWLHAVKPGDDLDKQELRPAIMSSAGIVSDYLSIPHPFKFIAIVQADEDAYQEAKDIYRQRFGATIVDEDRKAPTAN